MMLMNFRVWLKDRQAQHKRACFITYAICDDMKEAALQLMIEHCCEDYECYRVDFVNIECFSI